MQCSEDTNLTTSWTVVLGILLLASNAILRQISLQTDSAFFPRNEKNMSMNLNRQKKLLVHLGGGGVPGMDVGPAFVVGEDVAGVGGAGS